MKNILKSCEESRELGRWSGGKNAWRVSLRSGVVWISRNAQKSQVSMVASQGFQSWKAGTRFQNQAKRTNHRCEVWVWLGHPASMHKVEEAMEDDSWHQPWTTTCTPLPYVYQNTCKTYIHTHVYTAPTHEKKKRRDHRELHHCGDGRNMAFGKGNFLRIILTKSESNHALSSVFHLVYCLVCVYKRLYSVLIVQYTQLCGNRRNHFLQTCYKEFYQKKKLVYWPILTPNSTQTLKTENRCY